MPDDLKVTGLHDSRLYEKEGLIKSMRRKRKKIPHVIWKSVPQSLLHGSATPAMGKEDCASSSGPKKEISSPPLSNTVLVISHCPEDTNAVQVP